MLLSLVAHKGPADSLKFVVIISSCVDLIFRKQRLTHWIWSVQLVTESSMLPAVADMQLTSLLFAWWALWNPFYLWIRRSAAITHWEGAIDTIQPFVCPFVGCRRSTCSVSVLLRSVLKKKTRSP